MWRFGICVVIASGCGRVAFDDVARGDAGVDGGDGGDGGGGGDCWAAWRSGAPTFASVAPVSELADPGKQGNPWLSGDGRTLYYDTGTGNTELLRATRAGPGQPFDPPIQLTELSSPVEESGIVISANDRVAVIASSRTGSFSFDLWHTERSGPGQVFAAPVREPYVTINDGNNQYDAFLSADGLRVFYATNVPGIGQELRMAARTSTATPFATPVAIPGMGTFAVEADPDLSPDERVVVFSASSPLTLHAAVRATTADAFGPPFPLSSIAGPGLDADPALSADGCELFFISDRGGNRDVHRAVVVP